MVTPRNEASGGSAGWNLRIHGVHVDNRLTPGGVVGVIQPVVVIEPSEGMTNGDETLQWQSFMSACGRDSLTGDRLLLLRVETPADGNPGRLEFQHVVATHAFEIPETEWPAVQQIAKLVSVQVLYKFRAWPELAYRGIVTDDSDSAPDLSGEGAEFWTSRFGRAPRPKSHFNAMKPVSRNLVEGTSPADVFVLDLTRFTMPATASCVFCTEPLASGTQGESRARSPRLDSDACVRPSWNSGGWRGHLRPQVLQRIARAVRECHPGTHPPPSVG